MTGNSSREARTALTDRDGDGDDKGDADDEGESSERSVWITVLVRCFRSHLFYVTGAASFSRWMRKQRAVHVLPRAMSRISAVVSAREI